MAPSQAGESTKRGRRLSFGSPKSDRSRRSSGSGQKISLVETPEEKAKRTLHTRADPTVAMNEAQPAAVALEKSNLGSLRGMTFKDRFGNVITDPDLSNPTRHRFERPLETIRSFEAAIEESYNSRRASSVPTEDQSNGAPSRRGSYVGGQSGGYGHSNRGYYDQGGYYGRGHQSWPDSYVDNYGSNSQHHNSNYNSNSYYQYNNHGGRQRQHQPYGNSGHNFYPQQGYQRSYDNVTAASGSGSGSNGTDQWGNSTDPSSVNSSLDRLQQQQQQQQQQQEKQFAETYGFNGFGAGPELDYSSHLSPSSTQNPGPNGNQGYAYNGAGQGGGYQQGAPARDPNSGGPVGGTLRKNPVNDSDAGEKRKSWFKKRFSKS